MRTLQEIEAAVAELLPEELAGFQRWLAKFAAQRWEQQLAADAVAGRLDELADEALRDYQAGRTRPL